MLLHFLLGDGFIYAVLYIGILRSERPRRRSLSAAAGMLLGVPDGWQSVFAQSAGRRILTERSSSTLRIALVPVERSICLIIVGCEQPAVLELVA